MKTQRVLALAVVMAVTQWGDLPFGSMLRSGSSHMATAASGPRPPAPQPPPPPRVPVAPPAASAEFEPIDGTGNNVANPTWGIAGADLLRIAPPAYADGIHAPSLPHDLSARVISNLLNDQASPDNAAEDMQTVDQNSCSDFGYAFGQFIDHDMDLTPDGGASFPITVAADDPIGPLSLPFSRSLTDAATGISGPAQQVNVVTSYLDLSQVYGSSQTVASALRSFSGGLLKTSPGNMLPYDNDTYFSAEQITALNMANDAQAVATGALFATGDRRGNENLELSVLETLFVRNHNLIAQQLQSNHGDWSDEELYQEARKLNIAEYQSIIYNEWIPAVMGPHAIPAYAGYNPTINAGITNEFSTVAFRFGHSMLSPEIERQGSNGVEVQESVPLEFDFFDPNLLNPNGVVDPLTGLTSTDIGPVLKAESDGDGQAMDPLAISAVRNLLFGNGGLGGDDLMARDVQRGRDNGMPDYNTLREAVGLPRVSSFNALTTYIPIEAWQAAYPGGVGTIDAFEGGLAEAHVPGSDVGPTFQAIMSDQFRRLRDGDRFFYLNEPFNQEETAIFQRGNTLAKVIMANSSATNLQPNVMLFRASIGGTVAVKGGGKGATAAGIGVELEDGVGDLLAQTKTNAQGQYFFDQQSGPSGSLGVAPGVSATGFYKVVLLPPPGATLNGTGPAPTLISHGDDNVSDLNFALTLPKPPAATTAATTKKPKPRKKK